VMSDIKYIDIKEFREAGYLQEANRRFFHPLGLALEVIQEKDGTEHLGGVWDYRDDNEGMIFANGYGSDVELAARVDKEWAEHASYRQKNLGFVIQPIEDSANRGSE